MARDAEWYISDAISSLESAAREVDDLKDKIVELENTIEQKDKEIEELKDKFRNIDFTK